MNIKKANKLNLIFFVILLTGFNLTISMEQPKARELQVQEFGQSDQKEYEAKENYMLSMPNEMLLNIIEEVIRSHMSKWTDIFNFDEEFYKEKFNQDMTNLLATCKRFKFFKDDIIRSIKRIKAERFEYLKDQIKRQNKLSKEELNKKLNETLKLGNIQKVAKLILAGADDVNAQNKYGVTALMMSAWDGFEDVLSLLINAKTNVDEKENILGETALMLAARKGHISMVKSLLAAGADINIRNISGRTVLAQEKNLDHNDIVELLIANGARE